MSKKLLSPLLSLALASLALVACGGGDSTATNSGATSPTSSTAAATGGGSPVEIQADPSGQLAFEQAQLSAKAGSDTIKFTNDSSTAHNVEIEDAGGNEVASTDTITGSTAETTADLEPGTYTFYCSVDGHRAAGMEGTITVK